MTALTASIAAKLNARRARREQAKTLWADLRGLARAVPLLWRERHRAGLRRVMRSTVPVGSTLRVQLSLFSEPRVFFAHLLTQDHPLAHRALRLAVPLPARAFWPADDASRTLEAHADEIAGEYRQVAEQALRHPNSALLVEAGTWSVFPLYKGGERHEAHCLACPKTAALVESMPHCAEGGDGLGQITFSVLEPGTHLRPHQGSVNVRLRYHLGLVTPDGPWLRVDTERRGWERGKVIVFDDSLEHEVRHEGSSPRVVFLVDLWHPELSEAERHFVRSLMERLSGGA